MPYRNAHSCRRIEPREVSILGSAWRMHEGKRYRVIYGRKRGETSGSVDQAYRYPISVWSESQARAHCRSHDGILFEPAKPEADAYEMPSIIFASADQMAPFTEHEGVIRIPTIFTREGVQNRGFKPFEELVKAAPTLNGKPVIYWHPPGRRPVGVGDMIVGRCTEVEARASDRVLHGYVNIQVSLAPSTFIEDLRKGDPSAREGSVGYWADWEDVEGEYDGKPYNRIECNIFFDHYAIGIPVGACSVWDGCGLGFDHEMSLGPFKGSYHDQGGSNLAETIDLLNEMDGEKMICLKGLRNWIMNAVLGINYGKAPEDKAWDLDKGKYTPQQASHASAVVEKPGTSEAHRPGWKGADLTKDMCRLIHHLPGDGKSHGGTLVWRGVSTAGAAIQGSRGGVKLSAEAKAIAKKHLTAHYHEFKRKAPWEAKGDMQINEEELQKLKDQVARLEQEKTELSTSLGTLKSERDAAVSNVETITTERNNVVSELDALKVWKTETEPKIQSYEAAQAAAIEAAREEKLKSIAKLQGSELNDEFKETYKDWDEAKLEHLEKSLVRTVDNRGRAHAGVGGESETAEESNLTSIEVAGKKLTVGNLFKEPE